MFIHNTTRHVATKYSPYELLFGRTIRSPFNIEEPVEYAFEDHDPDRILAREEALGNMNQAARIAKWYYDKKHSPSEFIEGQDILLRMKSMRKISRKLAHRRIGPFKLVKLVGGKQHPRCAIYLDENNKLQRAAMPDIKPYHSRSDVCRQTESLPIRAKREDNKCPCGSI